MHIEYPMMESVCTIMWSCCLQFDSDCWHEAWLQVEHTTDCYGYLKNTSCCIWIWECWFTMHCVISDYSSECRQVVQRAPRMCCAHVSKAQESQHWPFLFWKCTAGCSRALCHTLLVWMATQAPFCCLPLSWRLLLLFVLLCKRTFAEHCSTEWGQIVSFLCYFW